MTDRRRVRVIVLASALALGPSVMPDSASSQPADADQEPFRVEWEPQLLGGHDPALKGYVENRTQMRITDIRLRVEALDGSGTVVGQSFGWVFGDVPGVGPCVFCRPPRGDRRCLPGQRHVIRSRLPRDGDARFAVGEPMSPPP
jgi:hypothetical protein